MTTPDFLLTCNFSTGIVTTGGSDTWAPPMITWGESKIFALRFAEQQGAQTIEPTLDVRATKASYGPLDARPESGRWKLQIGSGAQTVGNTSNEVEYDCSPAELAAAINARAAVVTAYGTAAVTKEEGSWLIQFGAGSQYVPMTVRDNTLQPICRGEMNAWTVDEVWRHEVRLTQASLALTNTAERVLPPPPVTTIVRPGGSGAGYSINQQQQLYVPPAFRGSYYLQDEDGNQTVGLSTEDSESTTQAALETILGKGNVIVTLPESFTFQIELTGDLKGTNPDKLTVVPFDPPAGDLTFTIAFNKGQLLRSVRKAKAVTLPLEVTIYLGDAREKKVVIRQDVTVRAPLSAPDESTVPEVDLLRPASPKDYVPFSTTPTVVGHQFKPFVVGNGVLTEFTLDDGVDTDTKFVFGRENVSPGRQLIQGVDFDVLDIDEDSVRVTSLTGAPAAAAWLFVVFSAQTVEAFADGLTITTGQVTGLDALLAALSSSVAALAALAPTTPLGIEETAATGSVVVIEIADYADAFPSHDIKRDGNAVTIPADARPGWLLPAIHDASVTNVTGALPSIATASGNVYSNGTGAAVLLPGGGGMRATNVAVGGFFGGDGRRLYPLSHDGSTTSYFPRDFERLLFDFEVSQEMLRAGKTMKLRFGLSTQLLRALTRMQAVLVVEHGAVAGDTSPATTGTNLSAETWNGTPMLKQQLILGPNKETAQFGVDVIRAAGGGLSANKLKYGFSTAADSVPAAATFACRGRLINFDTINADAKAVGIVLYELLSATVEIF